MSVQPVSPDLPMPVGSGRHDSRGPVPAGVTVVLTGALLLALMRSLPIAAVVPRSPWDSWIAVVLPVLALPAALLWWARSPASAQRLLPLAVGVALVPAAVLTLVPTVLRSVPEVVVSVLALFSSAAIWSVTAVVLICAASLASSGRVAVAGLAAAMVVLAGLLAPTVALSMRALAPQLPSQVYPLLLLVVAVAFIVNGSIADRADGVRQVVPAATAVATMTGGLVTFVAYVVTYFEVTPGGRPSSIGWAGGLGAVLVVVAVGGAIVLGHDAVRLVVGAGLLVGCLYGLTSSVGLGLGRDWWLPLVILLVLVGAVAVATLRAAREVGLSAIALLVVVLVATYLVVEFGHLDESLEIGLTLAGLVAGAVAGGAIVGALVPRLTRPDHLVPVVLLALTLGTGVSRLLAWTFGAADLSRNATLLWICAALVLAAVVIALWTRTGRHTEHSGPATGPGAEIRHADR